MVAKFLFAPAVLISTFLSGCVATSCQTSPSLPPTLLRTQEVSCTATKVGDFLNSLGKVFNSAGEIVKDAEKTTQKGIDLVK